MHCVNALPCSSIQWNNTFSFSYFNSSVGGGVYLFPFTYWSLWAAEDALRSSTFFYGGCDRGFFSLLLPFLLLLLSKVMFSARAEEMLLLLLLLLHANAHIEPHDSFTFFSAICGLWRYIKGDPIHNDSHIITPSFKQHHTQRTYPLPHITMKLVISKI